MPPSDSETAIVRAVQAGEIDRFEDLVARYESQVYAIAWSRLGDASLAEEAAQISFIKAYRCLPLLRNPERFAFWLIRITRAVSINLGLRHRRELRRRTRWEWTRQSECPDPTIPGDTSPHLPEDVSAASLPLALEALPARHRECLVLHYLENQSVAASATTLGISPGAFKVRLHRARLALRARLQDKGPSDATETMRPGPLPPRHALTPGIMAAIAGKAAASDPTATTSGTLATAAFAVLKLIPTPLLAVMLPVVLIFVTVRTARWTIRADQENYRDPKGPQSHFIQPNADPGWILGLLIGLQALALPLLAFSFLLTTVVTTLALAGLVPLLAMAIQEFRLRGIHRNVFFVAANFPLWATLALPDPWLPPWFPPVAFAAYWLAMACFPPSRTRRFDDNLFLRARLQLLPKLEDPGTPPGPPLETHRIRRFGRWMAGHQLVHAFQHTSEGVRFALTPVGYAGLLGCLPWVRRSHSTIHIRRDGSVSAQLGSRDAQALLSVGIPSPAVPAAESQHIAFATARALKAWLSGHDTSALAALGHRPTEHVFKTDPNRLRPVILTRGLAVVCALALLAPLLRPGAFLSRDQRRALEGFLNSVNIARSLPASTHTASEVKTFLGADGTAHPAALDVLRVGFRRGLLLPPPDWVSVPLRSRIATELFPEHWRVGRDTPLARLEGVLLSPALTLATASGWLELDGRPPLELTPGTVRQAVESAPAAWRARWMEAPEVPWHGGQNPAPDLELLQQRIAALKRLGILDAFNTTAIAGTLLERQQVHDSTRPPQAVTRTTTGALVAPGLFLFKDRDPILDTYRTLSILRDLGVLHRIDRQACIDGLLRFHVGTGLVVAPAGSLPFYLTSDARDTFALRESLALLNALDVVPDVSSWLFRPFPTPPDELPEEKAPGMLTWNLVEAVLLRERR